MRFNITKEYFDEDDSRYEVNIVGDRVKGSYSINDSDVDYSGYIDVEDIYGDYPPELEERIDNWVYENIGEWTRDCEYLN